MQFHLNGFGTGSPDVAAPSALAKGQRPGDALPEAVDVLIVGCGPAGLTLAAQLSAFPGIVTRIVEAKDGPLLLGQADGVACRTMEMFEAFGFRERVEREAYWVNETTFWRPDPKAPKNIIRQGRVQDVEDGLSKYPHVILNQARVHDFYLDIMRNSANRLEPDYARRVTGVEVASAADGGDYPVTVKLERVDAQYKGQIETVRARYVVGCDGARSVVRQSLGRALHGDSANKAWGVMDVLAVTDFPDIRFKSLIQSEAEGNILLIPREGGYLVRTYVELDKLNKDERVSSRNITLEQLVAAAQRIFRPFTFDVKEVAWWSIYEIGQRLTDKFDDVPADAAGSRTPRVFIAGDACHTHSPKAGQGMNVSMQDAFNLGWKLAAVLEGRSGPDLLHSYSAERHAIAKDLIDFDREWSAMLSKPQGTIADGGGDSISAAEVQKYFVRHGHYTAGTATQYKPSALTGSSAHQDLAAGFVIGKRLHSTPVIRFADGKPMELLTAFKADGRWRVLAFSGQEDPAAAHSKVRALCNYLSTSAGSPVVKYTRAGDDVDSVIDVRAVFQQSHHDLELGPMPDLLLPRKGKYGLRDYEKMFCPDLKSGADIFEMRGVDRAQGCMVIVRPDQYVAHVLPLTAHADLAAFFDGFMIKRA